MTGEPLISVVVPVYRVEKWLCRCVDSLLAQTYRNMEIILVDDGSPDQCGAMCDAYAVKENRVRVIHQSNEGLSAARNAGTELAAGQYITFVDSDDWVEPDFLEQMWTVQSQTSADVVVCGYCTEPAGEKSVSTDATVKCLDAQQALEALCYQKSMETSAWAKLYRTEDARRFPYPRGRLFEDISTTYKFFANAKRIAVCNRALYHYWQHPDSIMSASFRESRFDELTGADELYAFLAGQYPALEKAACCRRFSCYCQVLLLMPEQGYEKERKRIWQVLKASRKRVLMDGNARMKNRVAALLCYGGEKILRFAWAGRR